ncbi:RNA 2',3'-cyclic phosphodiesterase [Algoriphagus aquatilis]|uniref:RNA 2',3'-cyclic phosphodiesterase n=1 Tax=Algoriphagus aquatilis TaxID=490186 RepID=A0ABW0BUC9_9BACT|nr:RNA 2',3'-cyclic phosphodiesterase [Algoriphagus sp.]
MKIIQKYFLALIPPDPIISKSHEIKEEIRKKFGLKYALKSPPHITLKMPFSYNEAKEDQLTDRLSEFLVNQKSFSVGISGIGTFGQRVIFQGIRTNPELLELQKNLKSFCKRELLLVDELSDRNYHPHLTLAFKDLKPSKFDGVLELVKDLQFDAEFKVDRMAILKKNEGKWQIQKELFFGING